ncbi:taste receptor type 2 member 41-like [Microcaecilia unicolor]|uniref:Taste receptor type 2 n=1 Tax=Microcaecilia unicolor TaxID=1415580 RepID=A0A6P7WHG2_9AMPH|nr:taste receptor type 2 member 41-like [Microcaecilia unicolor]
MSIKHWVKRQDLNPDDLIISSLGACNIICQCLSVLNCFVYYFWRSILFQDHIFNTILILWLTLQSSNIWFATLLCLYFCVKIVNYQQPVFLLLKMTFPKMVPWILPGTFLSSLVISIPVDCRSFIESYTNLTANVSNNVSSVSRFSGAFLIYFTFCVLGFIIYFFSAMAILASLSKHVKRMKNLDSLQNLHLKAHFGAAKTVMSLFILYFICFVVLMIWVSRGSNETIILDAVFTIVSIVGYALSPIILILRSRRLNNGLTDIFHLLKRCCRREA